MEALIAAAILSYQRARQAARLNFFADAGNVSPSRIPPSRGQQIDLSSGSQSYRLEVYAMGSWRYRVHCDGRVVEATLRSLTDQDGQPSGTLIIAHDVDARRRAELEAGIRARQQAAIASLGQRALAGIDLRWLIDQAMSMASSGITSSMCLTVSTRKPSMSANAIQNWNALQSARNALEGR